MTGWRRSTAWDLNKAVGSRLLYIQAAKETGRVLVVYGPNFGICFGVGAGGDYALFLIQKTIYKNNSNIVDVFYSEPRSSWF